MVDCESSRMLVVGSVASKVFSRLAYLDSIL
jgi:hypothetical protein